MKIVYLHVENFRAIRKVKLTGLQDMVVIAGPNGCGKSCVLDSIRLFKSVYGGYQPNEWQQWLGEFQIDFQRNPQQMSSLLRDRSKSSIIEAGIELSRDEITFIKSRLREMLEDSVWKTVVPSLNDPWLRARGALAAELRAYKPTVDARVNEQFPVVLRQLGTNIQSGRLEISPTGEAKTFSNILLELVFSSFYPKHIGVIDYHGSHRNYNREELGGINLSLDQSEDTYRQSSLYNYGNKYSNIKSEMAAEYVRQALREKSGSGNDSMRIKDLSETLQELFKIFFPGKEFLGPVPTDDGNLSFPVKLEGGATHDINDLSSGEKEVLFGYLRLRNSAPKHSVILLDEPELHLNPALIRGLPQFYHRNLSLDLDNQLWLVTHSDAFLREAVGQARLHVFHMQYAAAGDQIENQVREVQAGEEVEATILELVGDLAAYRPGAKVVFFEGENSEFDRGMVSRLFPEFEKEMNFVSGGNKHRVERLHQTLQRSVQAGKIPVRIYSVVDKDSDLGTNTEGDFHGHHTWDVYHIENYLLEPRFICDALKQIGTCSSEVDSPELVESCLRRIAQDQIGKLVSHKISAQIRKELIEGLELGIDPNSDDIGEEMHKSVKRSVGKVKSLVSGKLGKPDIEERVKQERAILEDSLRENNWKKHFKGRDVLRVFAGKYANGMRYEMFRYLVISLMADAGHQPEGMKTVLYSIASD